MKKTTIPDSARAAPPIGVEVVFERAVTTTREPWHHGLVRIASGLGDGKDLALIVAEAADRVEHAIDGEPDVVFAFASPLLQGDLRDVPRRLKDRFAGALIVGCSGGGVLAQGLERELAPAIALLGMKLPAGVEVDPVRAPGGASQLSLRKSPAATILLPDPFSFDSEAAARSFDRAHPGATLIGGIASGGDAPRRCSLFLDDWCFGDGAVGVALRGPIALDTIVAQGCRPIGTPMIVTSHDGEHVLSFDKGRPVEVLRMLFESLDEADRASMQRSLFLGVQMREAREYRAGDFLIRNVLGVDTSRGSLVVNTELEGYPVVQFHVRDAAASAGDLRRALSSYAQGGHRSHGALLFSCVGRGRGLYNEPDHDSRLFAETFGPIPIAGFFCNGEIGPVGGRTFVHAYTSAFGIFREP